jgi:ankyrin repeat protein
MNGARLLRLPNEILREVASQIDNLGDLNSLARTSHFFYTFLNTDLYQRAVAADDDVLDGIMQSVLADIPYPVEALTRLLDYGLPLDLKIDNSEGMLRYLSSLWDEERALQLARLLIERGADIEAPDSSSYTVLHIAAHCLNVSFASLLLSHGANVNAETTRGCTPLHLVCSVNRRGDHAAMINVLVAAGANVNALDHSGDTPLLLAREQNYRVVVPALLAHGADVGGNTHGKSPLHMAALYFDSGDHELAQALIERGAPISALSTGGRTPLHYACGFRRKKDLFMVRFLLEHGADVNARSHHGCTPLHDGMFFQWNFGGSTRKLVKLLINSGADISVLHPAYREEIQSWIDEGW